MFKPFVKTVILITLIIPVSACGSAATAVPPTTTIVSPPPTSMPPTAVLPTAVLPIVAPTPATTTSPPTPDTFSISGHVSGDIIAYVPIILSGAASKTSATDNTGYYEFTDLESGYYAITPKMEGYSFEPSNHTIPNLTSDLYDMDFVSTQIKPAPPCTAEMIYGEDSEEVELLRCLRDNVLRQSPEGREIIKLYYQWSPAIVKAMEEDEEFREDVKEMIDGVLALIESRIE